MLETVEDSHSCFVCYSLCSRDVLRLRELTVCSA
jgi:hypothetical protein